MERVISSNCQLFLKHRWDVSHPKEFFWWGIFTITDQSVDSIMIYIRKEWIETISKVKKCSIQGRSMMLKAFHQLVNEYFPFQKNNPHLKDIENYIQAYFIENQEEMKTWIQTHCFLYSLDQLIALANTSCMGQSIPKSQLLEMIEFIKRLKQVEIIFEVV